MRRRRLKVLLGLGAALLATTSIVRVSTAAERGVPLGRSQVSDASATAKADALIARMTVEEKVGQITQLFSLPKSIKLPLPPVDDRVRKGQVGSLLFVSDPAETNRLQRIAVTETRLKIPLLFGFDVIHGLRTILPVPLGMAASWDPAAVERGQAMAAREARAVGIHWAFAPMVDIARDPRWGRIVEGAGEDPFLGAEMARAQVKGFQGDALGTPDRIIAGPKHFLGYGASPGGRDYDSVFLSDSEIHNTYLPPFAAAVDAGAGNVMSAYMDINDIPGSANRMTLTDILRGELGFKGWVVSDADAVNSLVKQHFAANAADAAQRAFMAGNDMEMALFAPSFATLVDAVNSGRVPMATLDASVRRILFAKAKMGLFERPYADERSASKVLTDPASRELAQTVAEQSLVLLRNEGEVLPLQTGMHKRIAVIGPLADAPGDTTGPWTFAQNDEETVTVVAGLRARLGRQATVTAAPGVQFSRAIPSGFEAFFPAPAPWTAEQAETEFKRAVDLAGVSDLVVFALGEAKHQSGERASVSDLALPNDQRRLFEAVVATGKPHVVVLMNGRPLDLTGIAERSPAILEAWFPGTRGGTAIARALYGDINPGGKLPVTWPRSVGQVPIYYGHNTTQQADTADRRYYDKPSSPLYPFGYGLSYTSFRFDVPTLDKPTLAPGGQVTVSATVTNTGKRAGDEVVQLYIHQRAGRASRPVRQLRGFQRVRLAPGAAQTVRFVLDQSSVGYWNAAERDWVIDPGTFDVWVGNSSTTQNGTTFIVGGTPRTARRR
jgi:beta-glucosidase